MVLCSFRRESTFTGYTYPWRDSLNTTDFCQTCFVWCFWQRQRQRLATEFSRGLLSWGGNRCQLVEQDRMFNRRKRSQSRRVINVAKTKKHHFWVFFVVAKQVFPSLITRNLRRLRFLKIVSYSILTNFLFSTTITHKVPHEVHVFLLSLLVFATTPTLLPLKTDFVEKDPKNEKWCLFGLQR